MKEPIIEVYKDVLSGKRKRFPLHTWTKDEYGYSNFASCLRYIVEKNNMDREQIINIEHSLIERFKLRGALTMLYEQNLKKAIQEVFPEHKIAKWEFVRGIESDEDAKKALQSVVTKKGRTREDFLEQRSNLYEDKDIYRILDWAFRHDIKAVNLIQSALPEFNFTEKELTQRLDREKWKMEIKRIFEEELKWTEQDIENKMTLEIARMHFADSYKRYRNVLTMVQSAYPNIKVLMLMEAPLAAEAVQLIVLDIKSGLCTKDILNKYGISRNTLTRIKRENGFINQKKSEKNKKTSI
ncbi:DUF4046 domain-containing protein [Robertmurraya massiliosenegalensis]|uniref:DUF4046 domain-containing protein n=1 Tax=Robertmurraya massiliosenegalensis TaxID=1287657 RepID=UPI00030E64EB|nr:DUF4046 domain-containing protein [Robertmurraya massiliosenegalensis]